MTVKSIAYWSVRVVVLALVLTLIAGLTGCPPESGEVRQILEATGVKGGFVVHIGCGDGSLTAALRANESYLVHGLDASAQNVEAAREHIRSLDLYGKVSVEQWDKNSLPYTDNLVNLIVSENVGDIPAAEIMRVLAPQGVAYIKTDGKWTKTVKPRPEEIDQWTHYLYDSTGNAVAHDSVVGPPRHLQWVGSPKWARHHDHMASMSALVSTGDRIFYIFDEGSTASIQLPPKWFLIARDAFNGTILWKRSIPKWHTHLYPLKSGPAQLPRRLVAVGDRVYVTLGLEAPLTQIDAATGEIIRTYENSESTEEVITSDGVLFLMVNENPSKREEFKSEAAYCWDEKARAARNWPWDEKKRQITAMQADTGKILWRKEYPVVPLSLAADQKCVFFHDGEKIVCLNRENGDENWASEPVKRRSPIPTCYAPTLVVYKDVVLFSGGDRKMSSLSAETGEVLWTSKHPRSGHNSPEDLLVVDGMAWAGLIANGKDSGVFTGRDLYTGEVKNQFPPDVKTYWFHHRCYRSKATDKYLIPSRTGIEFVDVRENHWDINHWVRGGCLYGVMPCNGMVYAAPHSCACYIESKMNGFCALTPESEARQNVKPISDNDRLERGPAYGQIADQKSENSHDWPTYRHDPARSGFTEASVPADLKCAWEAELGGRLSSAVTANGKVFVASIDTHTVYALDENSGDVLWSYTASGRVDSPPTIYQGRVLFGSADGWVYCLRESDGELAWRFRAAPEERRLVAFEQLESVWPVHGSVLVRDDVVYCVAGRSMFLDGGMHLLRLDPRTGSKLSETVLDDRDPETGGSLQAKIKGLNMPVALPDVLSSDGQYVYMRSQQFDMDGNRQQIGPLKVNEQEGDDVHLFATVGFLDDSWFHRGYWMYGRSTASGWGGWFRAGRFTPSGRPLVFDDSAVYGFGRKPEYMAQSSVLEYRLFAADKKISNERIRQVNKVANQMNAKSKKKNVSAADWKFRKDYTVPELSAASIKWSNENPPLQVRAMVLANDTLFVAGPPDVVDEEESFNNPGDAEILKKLVEQDAALEGLKGASLWAVSAADGKKIAEYKLDSPPIFDGMIAANGRLYLATKDGKMMCFAGK